MMRTTVAVVTVAVLLACRPPACPAADAPGPPALTVDGKRLKTAAGDVVRLRGVNVPSLEWGQGEHLSESLRVAVEDWGANVLRLPLSQDRWFGHTAERRDGGAGYRKTVRDFVAAAAARRCYVVLDLHWSDAGTWGRNVAQHQMPDDHSVTFWEAVATAFANHPAVLFGLYNEPHDVSWRVWRDGGQVVEKDHKAPGGKRTYHTPGMQKLLDVCRARGARNVAVAGGLDWGYDLSGVAKGYALDDPKGHGVVYDTHLYPWKKDRDRRVAPAADRYAVLVGELGPGKGDPRTFVDDTLAYADRYSLHWTAWCLHPAATPCLIKDWKYTPTAFGERVRRALRAAAGR